MTRVALAWLLGWAAFVPPAAAADPAVELMHVHGLSYSTDGKRLYIPSHMGLAIYENGKWRKLPGPAHDFMGFSVARGAFYSSGHPAPGSPMKNPFGLMKSEDEGRSWQSLGLDGEADFHLLAASHGTRTVYVFAPQANSRMPQAGIYSTSDEGKSWRPSRASGLSGQLAALAAHPTQGNVVAAATDAGVYLSSDFGDSFARAASGRATSAVFELDGLHLWFGAYRNGATLDRLELKTKKAERLPIPKMAKDAVSYIAQNPAQRRQFAIATYSRDVLLSEDAGKSWKPIASQGRTQ